MPILHDAARDEGDTRAPFSEAGGGRTGVVAAGLTLTYLAAATIPWSAVGIAGVSAGDVFLLLAALTLLFAGIGHPLPKLPPWVWGFAVTVLVIGVAHQFAPPSPQYMVRRAALTGGSVVADTNLSVMVNLLGRIVLLVAVFRLAHSHDRRALTRVSTAFVAGVAVCAIIAFTDSRGWTSIGPDHLGIPVADRRGSGLTNHPNIVAMICVVALPLVVWRAASGRGRTRILAAIGLIAVLLGLYASRSRSGAAAAVIAGAVSLLWLPQYRRILPVVGLLATVAVGVLFVTDPGLGSDLLSGLRITGGDTSGSDSARSIVNDQAARDFLHSPVHGIGLEVAGIAHILYLQALAVGGVILLAGLVAYQLGALVRSARLARIEPLAIPLFAAFLGEMIFNSVQNALTPSFAYLAPALIAALPLRDQAGTRGQALSSISSTMARIRGGGTETSSNTPVFGLLRWPGSSAIR